MSQRDIEIRVLAELLIDIYLAEERQKGTREAPGRTLDD